jgi:hypothetical protein
MTTSMNYGWFSDEGLKKRVEELRELVHNANASNYPALARDLEVASNELARRNSKAYIAASDKDSNILTYVWDSAAKFDEYGGRQFAQFSPHNPPVYRVGDVIRGKLYFGEHVRTWRVSRCITPSKFEIEPIKRPSHGWRRHVRREKQRRLV